MSMTVIFSNAGDMDCQTLRTLWEGIDNVNVIELNHDKPGMKPVIREAIQNEEDFLLLCGHGCPSGLFNPYWGDGLAFDVNDIPLVKAKKVMCLWCYASSFCKRYNFNVLTSSMYISNYGEACCNNIQGYSTTEINEINDLTFQEMNRYMKEGVPTKDWPKLLMESLDKTNKIDSFNRGGMMYLGD